jgi:hypothetical protein
MQSTKNNTVRWRDIFIIFSFLVLFYGMFSIVTNSIKYTSDHIILSITIMLTLIGALFFSLQRRTTRHQSIMQFVAGLFIVLAIFSQAILPQNHYFVIVGLIDLIIFAANYAEKLQNASNMQK